LALGIVAALIVAFGITIPFAAIPLPRVDGFIAALETLIMFADLITFAPAACSVFYTASIGTFGARERLSTY
jgi:hypothetical protein